MTSNIPVSPDTINQSSLKSQSVDWIDSFKWHFAITLVWNRNVGMDRARADLSELLKRADRRLAGSHFHKLLPEKRIEAVFFFEGQSQQHLHLHSLWRAPSDRWFELGKLFHGQRGGLWNDVVETGSYDLTFCNAFGSNREIVGYLLKQQHRRSDARSMVWASDFHRS